MDKMQMAHEWNIKALEVLGDKYNVDDAVTASWKYADEMQAEAEKRKKAEAHKQSAEVHDLIGKPHFHYCENGACVHCGKSEKTIDDEMWRRVEEARAVVQEEWQPDWSQAPNGVTGWSMRADGRATWHFHHGVGVLEAPSFGYSGDWKESLRKRP